MDLVIAEKPSLAEAIADVLPGRAEKHRTHIQMSDGTVLIWAFGHMLEQCMPEDYDPRYKSWRMEDLPIVPVQWKVQPVAKNASQLSAIKGFLKTATRVIHAGDPDSEGQLIVDEILAHLGNKVPVARILVSDYNSAKVKDALANMLPNTHPLYRGWSAWALCRSRLDWLLGINLSRAYTAAAKAAGHDLVLTVGRVQSPTLALIVARDLAIENFKSIPFFNLIANVSASGITFAAHWRPREDQPGLDQDGRLIDPTVAQALQARLVGQPATVVDFTAKGGVRHAPLPYYLDTLQMAANDRFGYTAKRTLDIAQSLYETHKLTTYPRSDCPYLSTAQLAETQPRLKAVASVLPGLAAAVAAADVTRVGPAFNDAKQAESSHHGIVPTINERGLTAAALDEAERNIYELIASNFVAQFYPPESFEQSAAVINIGGERFAATGKRVTAPGWTAVFQEPADAAEEADVASSGDGKQPLPAMAPGAILTTESVQALSRKTSPPPRFTEKLLLKAMANVHLYVTHPQAKARLKEGQGIGTPATRANIIEELKSPKRGYLVVKGKQLISAPEARAFIAALPSVATDAGFTGLTEQTLDSVASGAMQPEVFIAKTVELVTTLVRNAQQAPLNLPPPVRHPCPKCKSGTLRKRRGSNGMFWSCSEYENGCTATFDDFRGKPRTTPGASKARKSTSSSAKKAATKKTAKSTASTRQPKRGA
ncbi:DNA topoisomerase 3 [Stenotrophomonas maltophilia]|uniref:DNA topoisomerase 3 n=1 Tax=Stenotrophomonas maltophilia TaxID=40324 RepID=UPI002448976D|nr:DNA topoisomerase 3 [Stenotrophomonas maltophilia]MDH0073194.1 DNA topoisomerase 3 [Stenotrophomonas maltophilia]MDH0332614.1 DNA topoisomerase 3 [Stenotrophomonas maltophilia]